MALIATNNDHRIQCDGQQLEKHQIYDYLIPNPFLQDHHTSQVQDAASLCFPHRKLSSHLPLEVLSFAKSTSAT